MHNHMIISSVCLNPDQCANISVNTLVPVQFSPTNQLFCVRYVVPRLGHLTGLLRPTERSSVRITFLFICYSLKFQNTNACPKLHTENRLDLTVSEEKMGQYIYKTEKKCMKDNYTAMTGPGCKKAKVHQACLWIQSRSTLFFDDYAGCFSDTADSAGTYREILSKVGIFKVNTIGCNNKDNIKFTIDQVLMVFQALCCLVYSYHCLSYL